MDPSLSEAKRLRRAQALLRARHMFLQDALERFERLQTEMTGWQPGESSADRLGEAVHHYAHALKGMALTLGCEAIHHASAQAVDFSIQQEGIWTEASVAEALALAGKLDALTRAEWEQLSREPLL